MFENCNSLSELNAARIAAVTAGNAVTDVNNAYNARRTEILQSNKDYRKLTPVVVTPKKPEQFCAIPVVGRSTVAGRIALTSSGFLY